uniref:Uncharacterized protein n=1 Tax=Anopheles atroparvus TaxID=41427 RepID=A0A182IP85_ANOAO
MSCFFSPHSFALTPDGPCFHLASLRYRHAEAFAARLRLDDHVRLALEVAARRHVALVVGQHHRRALAGRGGRDLRRGAARDQVHVDRRAGGFSRSSAGDELDRAEVLPAADPGGPTGTGDSCCIGCGCGGNGADVPGVSPSSSERPLSASAASWPLAIRPSLMRSSSRLPSSSTASLPELMSFSSAGLSGVRRPYGVAVSRLSSISRSFSSSSISASLIVSNTFRVYSIALSHSSRRCFCSSIEFLIFSSSSWLLWKVGGKGKKKKLVRRSPANPVDTTPPMRTYTSLSFTSANLNASSWAFISSRCASSCFFSFSVTVRRKRSTTSPAALTPVACISFLNFCSISDAPSLSCRLLPSSAPSPPRPCSPEPDRMLSWWMSVLPEEKIFRSSRSSSSLRSSTCRRKSCACFSRALFEYLLISACCSVIACSSSSSELSNFSASRISDDLMPRYFFRMCSASIHCTVVRWISFSSRVISFRFASSSIVSGGLEPSLFASRYPTSAWYCSTSCLKWRSRFRTRSSVTSVCLCRSITFRSTMRSASATERAPGGSGTRRLISCTFFCALALVGLCRYDSLFVRSRTSFRSSPIRSFWDFFLSFHSSVYAFFWPSASITFFFSSPIFLFVSARFSAFRIGFGVDILEGQHSENVPPVFCPPKGNQ